MTTAAPPAETRTRTTHRFEVRPLENIGDPLADTLRTTAERLHIHPASIRTARIYIVEAHLSPEHQQTAIHRLLADPAKENAILGAEPPHPEARIIEVHPLPGVMDPAANTVSNALAEILQISPPPASTGHRYDIHGITAKERDTLAAELANTAVHAVHHEPWLPHALPTAPPADQTLKHITITTLNNTQLEALSRDGHLFLSLEEMQAIQSHYRALDREPTDIELETLAQTWSEHCVHKTLKSTVTYRPAPGESLDNDVIDWEGVPNSTINPDGSVTIHNLLKSTIADATFTLIEQAAEEKRRNPDAQDTMGGRCLSVFVDNAGVVRFSEDLAIAVKVETHNHPSAIEPYGGAATGIGGVIRDIIGTGLAAKPIANTNYFCVAPPDNWQQQGADNSPHAKPLPTGVIHPRRSLTRIIEGVRDYGNRMGIPTINAHVTFHNNYIGNPLVFAGSIGIIPAHLAGSHHPDDTTGKANPGDLIVALGGRTGRDGIHGATFSSAELTDTHADEFSHAVQIGNPIEEKKFLDAILRARDWQDPNDQNARGGPLFTAITDCGAGGFSSAIGEMAEHTGATVHLDRAPFKYAGLRYDEIWISESQERMILAVPKDNLPALQTICDEEQTELAVLGTFGPPPPEFTTERNDNPTLLLLFNNNEVGRLPMPFLHDGIPMPTRQATWTPPKEQPEQLDTDTTPESLLSALARPNNASKQFIARQYDHEVQGNTIIRPFVGPNALGPSPAAVIQPDPNSKRGLAIACGLTAETTGDPYQNAIDAVDQCVRNLVCVGADPNRIAILDNFCWPSCKRPENMATLVRAAVGLRDAALAYRTPFISGKDSLNNQFTYNDPATGKPITIEIPPTLFITGVAIIDDINTCTTMDLKPVDGSKLVGLIQSDEAVSESILDVMYRLITSDAVLASNTIGPEGSLLAAAQMLAAGDAETGLELSLNDMPTRQSTFLLQLRPDANAPRIPDSVAVSQVGIVNRTGALTSAVTDPPINIPTTDLRNDFTSTFADW